MNAGRNSSMLARVQRKADKVYTEKTESYVKEVLENKANIEQPKRKITKFFTRG